MSGPFPFVPPPRPGEPTAAPPIVPMVYEPDRDDPRRALADRRIIFVSGRIDDVVANDVVAQLVAFDGRRDDPMTLLINSTGGPLTPAVAILDTMAGCESMVGATVVGQANGTAALLLALATGERLVAPNASVCLRLEPEPSITGTTDDVVRQAELRSGAEQRLAEELARRGHHTVVEILDAFDRGAPMTAPDAVAAGWADRLR
jgi:ATP-dependent Clp protease protease subunit